MSETTLNARLQHASIGNGLTNINSIPKQGEIIFNSTLDNFRVGDGSNTYSILSDFLPSTFTGASTSVAGTLGFVPAPAQKASGEADKFLCDDGSWKLVSGSGSTDTKNTAGSTAYEGERKTLYLVGTQQQANGSTITDDLQSYSNKNVIIVDDVLNLGVPKIKFPNNVTLEIGSNSIALNSSETWTFVLTNNTSISKKVVIAQ